MRVVVVDLTCNSPFYCGALVNALAESGADVELASPELHLEPDLMKRYRRSPWLLDIVVHLRRPRALRLAARAVELAVNLRRLIREIRKGRYDVVHVQWIPLEDRQTWFMSRLRAACDLGGAALVFTAHNVTPHDKDSSNLSVLRSNAESADLIIAHTENVMQGLRHKLGVERRIAIVPHGLLFVDMELPPPDEARLRLSLGPGPVVLFQGRIAPYKGLDLLVEAWPMVRAEYPDAVLAVVGRPETKTVQPLLDLVAGMPGTRLVDRFVPTDLVLDYYSVCNVVVFPYKAISQSGALMTAVGLARPTVVTPVGGLTEQVAELRSAVLASEVSGEAVARAISSALERKEALLAEAALDRSRVSDSPIGWGPIARSTLDHYVETLALIRPKTR